jgi:hypothetical protein
MIRSSIRRNNPLGCRGSSSSTIQTSLDRWGVSLIECRRCPWLPSESTKLDHSVCQTGLSDFHSFEEELLVPIHFVWQQLQQAGICYNRSIRTYLLDTLSYLIAYPGTLYNKLTHTRYKIFSNICLGRASISMCFYLIMHPEM